MVTATGANDYEKPLVMNLHRGDGMMAVLLGTVLLGTWCLIWQVQS